MEEVEEECDESSTRGMLIFFVSFLSFFLLLLLLEGCWRVGRGDGCDAVEWRRCWRIVLYRCCLDI